MKRRFAKMQKKSILFFCAGIMILALLSSCVQWDNGVVPFGEVSFPGNRTGFPVDDLSCMEINGKLYFDVGSAEDGIEKGEYIAAANGKDAYSYRIYELKDSPSEGIVIVHGFSKRNLASFERIYASADAINIPAALLFDFPHRDEWWNGGQIFPMNGVNYCIYKSTVPGAVSPGEKRFEYGGKEFFAFPGEPLWILCQSKADPDRFELYYDADAVTELPVPVFMTTVERP